MHRNVNASLDARLSTLSPVFHRYLQLADRFDFCLLLPCFGCELWPLRPTARWTSITSRRSHLSPHCASVGKIIALQMKLCSPANVSQPSSNALRPPSATTRRVSRAAPASYLQDSCSSNAKINKLASGRSQRCDHWALLNGGDCCVLEWLWNLGAGALHVCNTLNSQIKIK